MKNGVINSPPSAIWPHIARLVDQSDCNMPLSQVMNLHTYSHKSINIMHVLPCRGKY